ncbi:MAG: polymer-forming cytoskeletal protein, partial [Azonexus sp.]|nr:polymer-forming cytoskeletal protein [Azonexus sp.]
MWNKKTDSSPLRRIDNLIGAGMKIEGNIRFTGGLRIDGVVIGNVEAADDAGATTLVLGQQGRIEGAVHVGCLLTNGTIVGNVCVDESIEAQAGARIVGDIEYSLIEIPQGAIIEGLMSRRDGE